MGYSLRIRKTVNNKIFIMKFSVELMLIFAILIYSAHANCGPTNNQEICTGQGHCMAIASNSYPTGALTLYCFDKNGVDIDNLIEWTVNGQTYNNAGNCLIIDWSTGVQADGATVFLYCETTSQKWMATSSRRCRWQCLNICLKFERFFEIKHELFP